MYKVHIKDLVVATKYRPSVAGGNLVIGFAHVVSVATIN